MNQQDLPSTYKDSSNVVDTIRGKGTHMCPREGAGELANHVSTPEQSLPEVTACKKGLFSLLLTLLVRQVWIHCGPWHRF